MLDLVDLQFLLRDKVEKSCNGVQLDPVAMTPHLDNARYDYSMHQPKRKTHYQFLGEGDNTVTLLDNGQPAEVIAVTDIAIDSSYRRDPYNAGHDSIQTPSDYYVHAAYNDRYNSNTRSVSYRRDNHILYIDKPYRLNSFNIVVQYGVMREWEDIPLHHKQLILDRALADFIDQSLVQEDAGLVRIPTPDGSFEFDGGRVLLALRDRLIDNFDRKIKARTTAFFNG